MSDVLTKDELQIAIRPRREKIEGAQLAYDEALAATEASAEMPKNGCAFLALDEQRQRRVARSLIERIVVSPPVAGGTIEDRFHVVWAHRG